MKNYKKCYTKKKETLNKVNKTILKTANFDHFSIQLSC